MVKTKLFGHLFMLLDFPRRPKFWQETRLQASCDFVSSEVEESERRRKIWSGRRDLNPRLRPWQGRTLPLSYSRSAILDYKQALRSQQRAPRISPHALHQREG
jgi:hypothetical protein